MLPCDKCKEREPEAYNHCIARFASESYREQKCELYRKFLKVDDE